MPVRLNRPAAPADSRAVNPGRTRILGLLADLFGSHRRAARMTGLLAGIILLSVADLYMTLLHLRGMGLAEGNPIARSVISYNSPAMLIVWKLGTVGLAVGILIYARRRVAAEIGALVGCAVLVALTIQWARYNSEVGAFTSELNSADASTADDSAWMTIHPGG